MKEKIKKGIIGGLILPLIFNFGSCSNPGVDPVSVRLRQKNPSESSINLLRNQQQSLEAIFESNSSNNNLEALVNGEKVSNFDSTIVPQGDLKIINMKKDFNFENIGTYDVQYNVFVDGIVSSANWSINVKNSLPKILLFYQDVFRNVDFYYVENVDFFRTQDSKLFYGFQFQDEDSVDILEKNVKLYLHGDEIRNLSPSYLNEINLTIPGTYEIVVEVNDGHDLVKKKTTFVYSNHKFFSYSKKYEGETGDFNFDDVTNLENILDKYYKYNDAILLKEWNEFFSLANPNKIFYNSDADSFNFLTSDLSGILIEADNSDLVNSLNYLTKKDISISEFDKIFISNVTADYTIFNDQIINFRNESNDIESLDLDFYIIKDSKRYGFKYNPTIDEINKINDYNSQYEGISEIIYTTKELSILDVATQFYHFFKK